MIRSVPMYSYQDSENRNPVLQLNSNSRTLNWTC